MDALQHAFADDGASSQVQKQILSYTHHSYMEAHDRASAEDAASDPSDH
jgi:hypothetical protein